MAGAFSLPLLGLLLLPVISILTTRPIAEFTRDPSAVLKTSPLIGLVSNLGVLLWCASTVIALFSALVLRRSQTQPRTVLFLLSAGGFTMMLMLDDFFMGHEALSHRGVPEEAVFLVYGLLFVAGLWLFRPIILASEYSLLIATCILLGLSVIVDVFQSDVEQILGQWRILFEDGFKFLGITGWLAWITLFCVSLLSNRNTPPSCDHNEN